MNSFLNKFRLNNENKSLHVVIGAISKTVVFRGASLWMLLFAIFVVSPGLNINQEEKQKHYLPP